MSTARLANIGLVTAAVILALANVAVYWGNRPVSQGVGEEPSAAQVWRELSDGERLAYVRQYQSIMKRGDASTVLRHGREFAALSADEQKRLRELLQLAMATIERQRPAKRRELLRAAPGAQAYLLYEALLSESPETVAALRAAWRGEPVAGSQPAERGP